MKIILSELRQAIRNRVIKEERISQINERISGIKNALIFLGESVDIQENHLHTRKAKLDYVKKFLGQPEALQVFGEPYSYEYLCALEDDDLDKMYRDIEDYKIQTSPFTPDPTIGEGKKIKKSVNKNTFNSVINTNKKAIDENN